MHQYPDGHPSQNASTLQNIFVFLLAALTLFYTASFISDDLHRLNADLPLLLLLPFIVLLATAAVQLFLLWRQKKTGLRQRQMLNVWESALIFGTAFIFFKYGFMKLLGLHMNTSLVYDDMTAGNLSGYQLIDYYFGRAPLLKLLIAVIELAGAALLLFGKTRLLAIFLLLPVTVTIAVMDLAFNVGTSITIVACLLVASLSYLLYKYRLLLAALVFRSGSPIFWSFGNQRTLLNLLRLSALLLPVLLMLPRFHTIRNKAILGRYDVVSSKTPVILGGGDAGTVLTNIYFDENDDCIMRFGNDFARIKVGKAIFNDSTGQLQVAWRYPANSIDTMHVKMESQGASLRMMGLMGSDTIDLMLDKIPDSKWRPYRI